MASHRGGEAGPAEAWSGGELDMHVWWINLDSRVDRRERMERVLARYGLADRATRISAVTPDDNRVAELVKDAPDDLGGRLWACGLSHFEAWRRVAGEAQAEATDSGDSENGAGAGSSRQNELHLILEDDVTFLKGWQGEVARLVRAELPAGWEVLYLDCMPTVGGWSFSPRVPPSRAGRVGVSLEGPVEGVVFADAYLLTPAAAAVLLQCRDESPLANAETVLMRLQDRGRCFAAMPRLALQTWHDSSIQPGGRVGGFHGFYEQTYHAHYPKDLYDYDAAA